MKVYTFGHSVRSLEDFQSALTSSHIEILVDLRQKPQSRYFPHFNRKSLENTFQKRYIFGGNFLGGSSKFHNDLLEYIQNRGEVKNHSDNKLFYLIDDSLKNKFFLKILNFQIMKNANFGLLKIF